MLPREDLFVAPHHPNAGAPACRAAHLLPSGSCPQATSQPNGVRGFPGARGALERRCQARRLTRAWSWRRPAVRVEFHLCRTKLGAAAQARSVRQRRSRELSVRGILLIGFVAGIILLGVAGAWALRDSRGARWPSTPGRLSWLPPTCTTHAVDPFAQRHERRHPYTTCNSRVTYQYRVGDRDYSGTQVTFNDALLGLVDWNWEAGYMDSSRVIVPSHPTPPAIPAPAPRTPGISFVWFAGVALALVCWAKSRSDAAA